MMTNIIRNKPLRPITFYFVLHSSHATLHKKSLFESNAIQSMLSFHLKATLDVLAFGSWLLPDVPY